MVGCPLVFRHAVQAVRKAMDRVYAFVALAVSGFAMLQWLYDTIVMFVDTMDVFGPGIVQFLKYLT